MALQTTKYNYIEIVNRLVPEFYRETDFALYGSEEDINIVFLGKLLKAAVQSDTFLTVDGFDRSSLASYFLPEKKTYITPNRFQAKFLVPYKLEFDDFKSKEEFKEWFSSVFIPDIEVNNPVGFFGQISGLAFGEFSSLSIVKDYLVDNLGLFYMLNNPSLSGSTSSTDMSAVMVEYVVDPLFRGEPAQDKDAINALFRFFWENRSSSTFYESFFPPQFAKPTSSVSGDPYLSGTQLFDAIQVQLESWTDPRLKNNEFFRESMDALFGGGSFPSKLRDAGPFQRFLKAVSLGIADISLIIEEIGTLLSIDECPERFLELLANNIGWRFLTGDFDKWRAQLRNAVLMYKAKGSWLGFDAACRLVFPDGVFSSSSVVEAWESYLPKLLYYLIKTESFVAKQGLEFSPKEEMFLGSWPKNVRFNQAPENYVDAKDRNYRFLVDAILEEFHNKFSGIVIHGKDFRSLPLWSCLPEVNLGNDLGVGKGFYHRNYKSDNDKTGFFVAVPPWEKYGFYKECELDPDRIEFFCNVLSGSRSEFGFEVPVEHVQAFKDLLLEAVTKVYSFSGEPTFTENNKFRIFLDSHRLPPNYSDFVKYGHASSLQHFDIWNTKSSFLFAAFDAASLDYTVDGYDSFKNKAALETYHDVLKSFIPMHAVARITLYSDETDIHTPKQTLGFFAENCIDESNTEYLRSFNTKFWAGASGTGNLGQTYVNGDGRVLPIYSSTTGDGFWEVSASDLDRNASRRRDYRYALPCFSYTRLGKGMPIALNHFGVATKNASYSNNPYINTWEFIIKGFEYDTQSYLPTSSVVWSTSGFVSGLDCNFTLQSNGFDVSTLYPVRSVGDTDFETSSLPVYRDTLWGIQEVMVSKAIAEDRFFNLSDESLRGFKFNESVHRAYSIYKNEFSGLLYNTLSPNTKYYGGYNFISYSFGPTVWNNDFRFKGKILNNVSSLGSGLPGSGKFLYGYEPQWEFVVGGSNSAGFKYLNYLGSSVSISDRPYFAAAPASITSRDEGIIKKGDRFITREILSGVEILQLGNKSKSFIVVNDNELDSSLNSELGYSVSIFNTDGNPLWVSFPFDPSDSGNPYYNKLRPQSQFYIDVLAKPKSDSSEQNIAIVLETSGVLDDSGKEVKWGYLWRENKWVPSSQQEKEDFILRIPVSANSECPETYRAFFHTVDDLTFKGISCDSIFKSGNVHTSSTAYLLHITNGSVCTPRNGVYEDGLTIYDVSIVDRDLNESTNRFSASDIAIIYEFWDSLSEGKYSRDSSNSSTYFETSGGSRAEYVELVGGFDYSTSSLIGSSWGLLEVDLKD